LTTKANTYPPTPKGQYGNAFNPSSINNTSTPKTTIYAIDNLTPEDEIGETKLNSKTFDD
jgi:hypothetical protein